MGKSDRTWLLAGVYASNFGLLLELLDCRAGLLPGTAGDLLLWVPVFGIACMVHGYFGLHRQWARGCRTPAGRRNRELILSIRTHVNNLFFLYPAIVLLSVPLGVEFERSPMPAGLVGLAGGVLLAALSSALFRQGSRDGESSE